MSAVYADKIVAFVEFQLKPVVQFHFKISRVILRFCHKRLRVKFQDLGDHLLRDDPVRNPVVMPVHFLPFSIATELQFGAISQYDLV